MAQVFFPQRSISVPASAPHETGTTNYKVSVGTEMWNGEPVSIIKVQMEYDGKVNGRITPSYPVGTDDFARVNDAVQALVQGK